MTQLPLFPREAEEPLAAGRRARRALQGRSERGRGYLTPSRDPIGTPGYVSGPLDPLGGAMADVPTGVLDFPRPPAGDPAYERFGLLVVDAPRGVAKGLRARSRWAGAR